MGLYNIIHWDWTILRAFSPHYWIVFLVHEGQDGWRLLGSIVLCITGTCLLGPDKHMLNILWLQNLPAALGIVGNDASVLSIKNRIINLRGSKPPTLRTCKCARRKCILKQTVKEMPP